MVVHCAPWIRPVLPLPEESAVVEPVPSSKEYAAVRLAGCTVMVAVLEVPAKDAVIVTTTFAVTVPAAAVKLAVVAPAATVSEAGTDTLVLLSETVTEEPPVGAACERVTVHIELPPDTTVLGEHVNEETTTADITRFTVALAELPP